MIEENLKDKIERIDEILLNLTKFVTMEYIYPKISIYDILRYVEKNNEKSIKKNII